MLKGAAAKLASTEDISSMNVISVHDEGATAVKVVDIHESSDSEQAVSSSIDLVDNGTDKEIMDKDEMEKDRMVEEILVYAVPPSDIRKKMQDVNEVEQEVRERFSSLGVDVRSFKSNSSRGGAFECSRVKVTPTNLRMIWGRRLGLKNCAVIEWKQPANQ